MLVVIAILGILLTSGIPMLLHTIHKTKMVGLIGNTASMFRLAKSESIKRNINTVLRFDAGQRRVEIFADLNGLLVGDPPDGVFNPIAGEPPRTTDYRLGSFTLPVGIEVDAPDMEDPIDAFTTVDNDGAPEQVAIFLPNGSIDRVGAIRLADSRGNFFEVRVAPQGTARIYVRKWDEVESEWFEKDEDGHAWEWS